MRASFLLLVLLYSTQLAAQQLVFKHRFEINFIPEAASIDRQGYLYFASKDGTIEKYDSNGKMLYHFSPQRKAAPTLLEAWQGLRVFAYYQNFQEYLFLNRFLTDSERYPLQSLSISNFSGLATLSGDNNLWLFDNNTLAVKKVDLNNGETILDNILSLSLSVKNIQPTFMREYQNLLFVGDKNSGVLVFDNLGNYMDTIPLKGGAYFSFSENSLVSIEEGQIVLVDIYSKQKRKVGRANPSFKTVFMENNQIIIQSGKFVEYYTINY